MYIKFSLIQLKRLLDHVDSFEQNLNPVDCSFTMFFLSPACLIVIIDYVMGFKISPGI